MSVLPRTRSDDAPATPARARPAWVPALVLFVASLGVYALTISHGHLSLDVWSADYGSWHLVRTGHPWIEGIRIPLLDHNPLRHEWVLQTRTGHTVIGRSPGVIAVALPLYVVLGTSTFSTVPGGLSAAALIAGSVTFLYLALRRHLAGRDALLAAAAFGFTTPVWSVAANGVWPHTITVFGICGMAWAASGNRWWWVGVFGGITLWGRLHAALVVALLGLLVGLHRRQSRLVLQVGAVSGFFLVLLSCWTRWMYGTWNPTASYDTGPFADYAEQHRLSLTNQLGFWVSPDRGILVWTPVVLLLVPALVRSWRGLPDWSRSLVWGGLAYTVLQGVLNRFSGGDLFYGYRLTLELLAAATPALALSAPRMGRPARSLLGPVLAVQGLAIAVGALGDGHTLDQSQVWHANAFVTFVDSTGVGGWATVLLVAGLGFLGALAWRRTGTTDTGKVPAT